MNQIYSTEDLFYKFTNMKRCIGKETPETVYIRNKLWEIHWQKNISNVATGTVSKKFGNKSTNFLTYGPITSH